VKIEIKDAPGGPYDPPIRDFAAEERYDSRVRTFLGFIVFAAVVFLAAQSFVAINQFGCHKVWEQSGMQSNWTFFAGCQVEVERGRWLPEATVRELLR